MIAGVEPAPNTCRAVFGEFDFCYTALVRFAGAANTVAWRYDSPYRLNRPAQGPDGTLYFIEYTSGAKSLVILNGATGAVTGRVPLANYSNRQTGCENSYHEQFPVTVGPIVGSDGMGYLLLSNRAKSQHLRCDPLTAVSITGTVGMKLLRFSSAGLVGSQVLDEQFCSLGIQCEEPIGKQLLPNGLGGFLIVSEQFNVGARLTHIDAQGVRVDRTIPQQTRIELVSHTGRAYLHGKNGTTSLQKQIVEIATWTPICNLPLEWNWVSASFDGGAVVRDSAGHLARFDATCQLATASGVALTTPAQELGGWTGNSTSGLRSYAITYDNGTAWSAVYEPVGTSGAEELVGYGDPRRAMILHLGYQTNYHQIRIVTETTPDQIFNTFLRSFSGVDAGTQADVVVPTGGVSAVGQRVTFTLNVPLAGLQGPFSVEIVRFDSVNRTIAAKTIMDGVAMDPLKGHPLEGWRYWRVSQVTQGEVMVETGAVDRPARVPNVSMLNSFLNWVNFNLFNQSQRVIWQEYLTHIVDELNAFTVAPFHLRNGVWNDPVFNWGYVMTHVCGYQVPSNGFCR